MKHPPTSIHYFHDLISDDFKIDFGRSPLWNCEANEEEQNYQQKQQPENHFQGDQILDKFYQKNDQIQGSLYSVDMSSN